jgi:hypothetical protein
MLALLLSITLAQTKAPPRATVGAEGKIVAVDLKNWTVTLSGGFLQPKPTVYRITSETDVILMHSQASPDGKPLLTFKETLGTPQDLRVGQDAHIGYRVFQKTREIVTIRAEIKRSASRGMVRSFDAKTRMLTLVGGNTYQLPPNIPITGGAEADLVRGREISIITDSAGTLSRVGIYASNGR